MNEAKCINISGIKVFLILWFGQSLSLLGSSLTGFALSVWIFEETKQATPFVLAVLFNTLPQIVLTPIVGPLVDRWSRRWIMILADTCNVLTTSVVLLLIFTSSLDIWHIYLLAFLGSSFNAFQEPAYTSSITMLVPEKHLTRANGMIQISGAIQQLLGPALAGTLYLTIGLSGIVLIDFIGYFASIGTLLFIHIPQNKVALKPITKISVIHTLFHDTLDGWRYLITRNGLISLLIYSALINFFINFTIVLIGPLVLSFGTPSTLGVVQTISGIGAFIGSIIISVRKSPKRYIQSITGLVILSAVGLIIIGLKSSTIIISIGLFIMMFCIPSISSLIQSIFQTKIQSTLQGRVFAIRIMITRSVLPLAYLSAGILSDSFFEPWMQQDGFLGQTFVGVFLGTGPGRGIGAMFVIAGILLIFISVIAYTNPYIKKTDELQNVNTSFS